MKITLILSEKIRKNNNVPKHELLNYYYENFLNEIYIFNQRMKNLFNKIEKIIKKLKINREYGIIKQLKNDYMTHFKNINIQRGRHIHVKRYKNEKFSHLDALHFVKDLDYFKSIEILNSYYKSTFRKNKCFFINNMKDNINQIIEITNNYLNQISPIVFNTILKR